MLENKLFEALLDVIPFGAYAVDIRTFEIVYANKLIRNSMYAPQETKCWEKLYGRESKCEWCTIDELTDIGSMKKQNYDFFDELDDRWIKSYDEFMSWPDGRDVKYSILVDITDQKATQGSMIQSHAKLAIKTKQSVKANKNLQITKLQLQKTVRELEEQKSTAEEANRSKSEFLANMSHEIRTPMNGIIGMTHILEKTTLDEKQAHYLKTINVSSSSLLSIINDILDFSKIEVGKLEIDKIDFSLRELMKNVTNIIEFKAEEKSLNFEIDYDSVSQDNLYGDSLRISQILVNLLNNAIKFTSQGFVKINITNEDDKFRFEIIDSGIGMTEAQQKKLFQSFSQADSSTTRDYGGTGLGLSISKQLVELMGGKIWAESKIGVGSTFGVELMLPEAKNPISIKKKSKTLSEDIQTLKGSKILLVEDNKINQEIIIGLLENAGLVIDIANNGKEGVELFRLNNYELILMDMQMPIMDGIEATRIIREINKEIPIIALTANAMKEDIEKTQSVGMNEHLNKPIDVEQLYETLLKYVCKGHHKPLRISKKTDISQIKDEIELHNFKSINTEQGIKYLAGNKKLYIKILKDFYINYKNLNLEVLSEDEYKRVLHTIKGLSANIGATNLKAITTKLEETCSSGITSHGIDSKKLRELFIEELSKILEEIKAIDKDEGIENEDKEQIPSFKRDELFLSLKEFASKRRANKCYEVLEQLNRYQHNKQDSSLILKIQDLLKNREYKEIIKI